MRLVARSLGALALTTTLAQPASAAGIGPGHDFWAVEEAGLVLGTFGLIPMVGSTLGGLGDASVVVERTTGLPTGDGVVDIELVALALRSVDPVNVSGTIYDVFLESGSWIGHPQNPTGQLSVTHELAEGGSIFFTSLIVEPLIILREVGNPLNTLELSPGTATFTSDGYYVWSHSPAPGDLHPFPAGDFYPGVDPANHEHRSIWVGDTIGNYAVLTPAVPEPTVGALLVGGLLVEVLARIRHSRRRCCAQLCA